MHDQFCLLGVNIDHIATLRQTRKTKYPDPIKAALLAEEAGADGITLHLREDRRHILDRDVYLLRQVLQTKMNLEMAATPEMLNLAKKILPEHVCLVPEKRAELTTEGGLDLTTCGKTIKNACEQLKSAGIEVSLFIDPERHQIDQAIKCGANTVELHTGIYANASAIEQELELSRLTKAVMHASLQGLIVNAGHGLHYHNVIPIAAIANINELNIGHAIVSHALFTGFKSAVSEMKHLMQIARGTKY